GGQSREPHGNLARLCRSGRQRHRAGAGLDHRLHPGLREGAMANELTIKQGTTPQQIENFLANEVNQDRKVLARHNERGELVLYEKPKASGLRDKLSAFVDRVIGRTERRLERAADVVMKAASEAMPKGYSDVREALSRQINQSWA